MLCSHFLLINNFESDDFHILNQLVALSSHINAAKTLCMNGSTQRGAPAHTRRRDSHMDTMDTVYVDRAWPSKGRSSAWRT